MELNHNLELFGSLNEDLPSLPVPAHRVYMCSIPIGVDVVNYAPSSSFILGILFLTIEACCDECRPPACKSVLIGWTAFT